MKRKIALGLGCLLIASSLFACAKKETDNNQKEDKIEETETVQEEESAESEEKEPGVAPTYAITSVEAEGYDNFTGKIQCIQITDESHEKLQTAIDALFSDMVSSFNQSAEAMNNEAVQANEEMKEYASEDSDMTYYETSYSNDISVEVIRSDYKVFSFVVYNYYYTGGAHGMTDMEGYTFDATTGEQLELSDFGSEESITETAMNFILDTIAESDSTAQAGLYQNDEYSEGYEEIVKGFFTGEDYPAYYLDNRGIVFIFQQYTLAPYAAGIITFNVPYSEINGFNEAYIPDDGFYSVELSTMGLIEKIDVDNDGELDNVYLLNDSYNEEESENTTEYHLFVNDASVSHEMEQFGFASGYYIHSLDGNFILVSSDGIIRLFEVSTGTIKDLGTIETDKTIKEIKDGEIIFGDLTYTEAGQEWGNTETHKYSKLGFE
ncbi:MAG: DUF3298 and DUF4163 domain-containing protein [Pseudobutyrivibrio ruminis]|nr:DUF3298 and DUF4163 domain-containing protein [Pseudobutyrivibrio ruminis]